MAHKKSRRTRSARTMVPDRSGCVVIGILLFLGVFLLAGITMSLSQWRMITRWRPVPAVVIGREVRVEYDSDGSKSYAPAVRYRYAVAGREYESTRVNPGIDAGDKGWAESQIEPFAPGARVTAYVDPEDPAEAFLVHRNSIFPWLFMVVPLVLIIGVLRLYAYFRRYHARPTPWDESAADG